jgi:TPR repeat protein
LAKACNGDNEACSDLALGYAIGWFGSTPDLGRSVSVLQKSCDAGNLLSCNNLGLSYARGLGVAKNDDVAIRLLRKSCQLGYGLGCDNLADVLGEECRTVLYDRACKLGEYGGGEACEKLAEATRKSSPPNQASAVQYDILGCKQGSAASCRQVGTAYRDGRGGQQDALLGVTYSMRACLLQDGEGCFNCAVITERGEAGLASNLAAAIGLYRRSCDLKFEQGCQQLARAQAVPTSLAFSPMSPARDPCAVAFGNVLSAVSIPRGKVGGRRPLSCAHSYGRCCQSGAEAESQDPDRCDGEKGRVGSFRYPGEGYLCGRHETHGR